MKTKYPVEQCKHFMKKVSEAEFGTLARIQRGVSLSKGLTFRKRPYNRLGYSQIGTLKKLKINEKLHDNSQSSSITDTSTQDDTTLSCGIDDENPVIITLCTPDSQK